MSKESRAFRRKELVQEIINGLLDEALFKRWFKEVVLTVLVEQEVIREEGKARTFLRRCQQLNIGVRAEKDGVVLVKGASKLSPELRAILALYKERIWEQLIRSEPLRNGTTQGKKK